MTSISMFKECYRRPVGWLQNKHGRKTEAWSWIALWKMRLDLFFLIGRFWKILHRKLEWCDIRFSYICHKRCFFFFTKWIILISHFCFKTLVSFQLRITLNHVSWFKRRYCLPGLYLHFHLSCAILCLAQHCPLHGPWECPSPFLNASTCHCCFLCQKSSFPLIMPCSTK